MMTDDELRGLKKGAIERGHLLTTLESFIGVLVDELLERRAEAERGPSHTGMALTIFPRP
jgi:hypothetical protein